MPQEVEREIELDAEPAEVWRELTESDWLGDDTVIELEPGGDLEFTDRDEGRRTGWVEEVEPERRLVFSWGDSRVEWTLAPVDGGTRLVVVERSLAPVVGPRMAALSAQASLCLA